MVVAYGIPLSCTPTLWWTLKLFNARVASTLGGWEQAHRDADLALMIVPTPKRNWAAPDEAARLRCPIQCYWGLKPRPRTPCLLSAIGTSDGLGVDVHAACFSCSLARFATCSHCGTFS